MEYREGTSSREKRNEIYSSLDARVNSVHQMIDTCKKYKNDGNKLLEELDNLNFINRENLLPSDYDKLNRLRLDEEEIYKILHRSFDFTRFIEFNDDRDNLLKLPNIACLYELENLTKGIEEKKNLVTSLNNDENKLLELVGNRTTLNQKIESDGVEKVLWGSFWVGIVVKEETYNMITKGTGTEGSAGFYQRNTPFFLIKSGRNRREMDEIISHELTHLILDKSSINFNTSCLGSEFNKETQASIQTHFFYKNEFINKFKNDLKPSVIIDSLHEEMIATDLLSVIKKESKNNSSDIPITENEDRFPIFLKNLRTAGEDIIKTLNAYRFLSFNEKIPSDIADFACQNDEKFCKILNEMYSSLVSSYEIAERNGEKAVGDFETLLYILKPTQYRHIKGFLQHKYEGNTSRN